MLLKEDVWSVLQEAGGEVIDLASILGSYAPRKTIEVLNFFVPIFPVERWWLQTVGAWIKYHEAQRFDFSENVDFLVAKNRQYGGKQLYLLGTLGIWLRSIDKVERIQTIDTGTTTKLLAAESRQDSLVDLFNYAVLAVLVIRKKVR